jgi:exosortase H (IPTLxxWG-CTERM-specific)
LVPQNIRFLLLFLCYAVLGFALQVTPIVDQNVVAPFILGITAASSLLIEVFGGSVELFGDILRSPINGFAVKVDNGCSGLEAVILICAAVLAFPTTWKMRLIGVLACSLAILGVNLIRIISLFYIGQYSIEWFEWAHLYAWDVLIMVDGVIAILLWIRYAVSRTPQTA